MIVLGIDPGLSGALAWYDGECPWSIPIKSMKVRARGREVDWDYLASCFDLWPADHAYVEAVGAMPKQGIASAFKFGFCAGGLRGLLAAHRIPVTYVRPAMWKKRLGLGASKDAARARAMELFPAAADQYRRAKDDGVAEATLIAYYGWKELK